MSVENKGSFGHTLVVSREPDRSGNFVCDGTADEVQINAAITIVNALGGGTVMLLEGQYNLAATVTGLDYVTIRGQGRGTLLYVPNNTFINAMTFDTKAYWAVKDLRIDGNYSNNPDQGTDLNQNCIYVTGGADNYAFVQNCWLMNPRRHGYRSDNFTNTVVIIANHIVSIVGSGIYCIGHHSPIVGNYFGNCNTGIKGVDDAGAVGNMCYNCTYGIWLMYSGGIAVGNAFLDIGYGIMGSTPDQLVIVGNSVVSADTYGIIVTGNRCTISGNTIDGDGSTGSGIGVDGVHNTVTSNTVYNITETTGHGIVIGDASYNNVSLNTVSNVGGDGIRVQGDSDYNKIFGNFIDTTGVWGINISAATCSLNIVRENTFFNCTSGCLNDVSGDTIMHILHVPFLEPIGTAAWDVVAPSGIEVDAADEGAFTMGVLPSTCQETHRVKVWAVGLAAPGVGNQMEITLGMDAGQPDEAYNAEAIAVANKDSDQTNFAINDIVTWTFTSADDSDIGDLIGEDCFEIRAMFVAGEAPDIDTDVLFRCVEIHYV